jgi:hypothetical protein
MNVVRYYGGLILGFWNHLCVFFVALDNEIQEQRIELAQLYPHEACIMSCRTLACWGLPTLSFAAHNAYLLATHDLSNSKILAATSFVRVVLAVPRPYYWWKMHTLFKQVCFAPF